MLDAAAEYTALGLAVLPLRPGSKASALRWSASPADCARYWRLHRDAGLALLTGLRSGVVVFDVDRAGSPGEELARTFPETPMVETPHGRHHYFAAPLEAFASATGSHSLIAGADYLAEGHLAILPPTRLEAGAYRWRVSLAACAPPPLPASLLERLRARRAADRVHLPLSVATFRGRSSAGDLEATLARLEGVRRQSRGYLARCPAHEDREPSLSITVSATTGRLLLKCFAGCRFGEILAALHRPTTITRRT